MRSGQRAHATTLQAHTLNVSPDYRGTSLIRNTPLPGPYSRTIPRVQLVVLEGGRFLMSEVPLQGGGGTRACGDAPGPTPQP